MTYPSNPASKIPILAFPFLPPLPTLLVLLLLLPPLLVLLLLLPPNRLICVPTRSLRLPVYLRVCKQQIIAPAPSRTPTTPLRLQARHPLPTPT
ncbi:hypothetical protein F4810DRAFT_96459 [Camillea tinctor]|nr:hypothetical protein F4810DRAFT_96459 [Camillea tinctor]